MSQEQEHFITWQPEVSQRGTFTIITTCLSTLVICVWSSLHLNIPYKRRTRSETLKAKLLWVTVGLLLPEILIWVAWRQRVWAAEIRDKINAHFGLERQRSWYHGFFGGANTKVESRNDDERPSPARDLLNSSGRAFGEKRSAPVRQSPRREVIVKGRMPLEEWESRPIAGARLEPDSRTPFINKREFATKEENSEGKNAVKHEPWTLVQGFYVMMGGLAYRRHADLSWWIPIHGDDIDILLEHCPDVISNLSIHAIENQSKADSLAKTILLLQVGWFCFSCAHRLIQHLPLALLEVSTLAHAFCLMAVYALWWDKPLNIQEPTIIPTTEIPHTEGRNLLRRSRSTLSMEHRVKFDLTFMFERPNTDSAIVFIITGLIYGIPHLMAWNSSFATHAEQVLWRLTSCTIALAPLFTLVNSTLVDLLMGSKEALIFTLIYGVAPLTAVVYFPSSLYLIIGSIRQLFYLTPAAFQVPSWSNYFPHFS